MRILLDACVPRRLAYELTPHEVQTVHEIGLGNLDDGPLLNAIANRVDILITVDRSISKQQRLAGRSFAVVVLLAKTNRLADLSPLVPRIIDALEEIRPGELRELSM